MPTRHFLWCLPLRLGTLLISLTQLVGGGLLAAASWFILNSMRGHLPGLLKSVVIMNAIYYTFLSFGALIGLFGVIGRKASLLLTYTSYLLYSIGMQLIIDVAYIWVFFSESRDSLIQRCIDGSTDAEIQKLCDNSFDAGRLTFLISMVVGLSIQLWAWYIVASYARKLVDETAWRSGPGVAPPAETPGSKYVTVQQQDDQIPLTGPSYAYPYSDTNHSFGGEHRTTASV